MNAWYCFHGSLQWCRCAILCPPSHFVLVCSFGRQPRSYSYTFSLESSWWKAFSHLHQYMHMTHVCRQWSVPHRDVKWIVSHSAMYMESIQFYIMRALYRWRNSSILSICQHVSSQHARISDTSAVHIHVHTSTCICTPEEPNMSKRSCPRPWTKKERNCMQFSDQELQHIGKWKTLVHDDVITERRRTGRHGSPGYGRGNRRRKIIIISRLTQYINSD